MLVNQETKWPKLRVLRRISLFIKKIMRLTHKKVFEPIKNLLCWLKASKFQNENQASHFKKEWKRIWEDEKLKNLCWKILMRSNENDQFKDQDHDQSKKKRLIDCTQKLQRKFKRITLDFPKQRGQVKLLQSKLNRLLKGTNNLKSNETRRFLNSKKF